MIVLIFSNCSLERQLLKKGKHIQPFDVKKVANLIDSVISPNHKCNSIKILSIRQTNDSITVDIRTKLEFHYEIVMDTSYSILNYYMGVTLY